MTESALTPEQILEAAEDILRRFGPAKATVVDVARALGVSHGSVYRHFPSKAALRDAVAERWLARVSAPLARTAAGSGIASKRLRRWFDQLIEHKRSKVLDDPELFATYRVLATEARAVVSTHVTTLTGQLVQILVDGVAQGEFSVADPAVTARAIFDATARFHNPVHAPEWSDPDLQASFEGVWSLVVAAITAGVGAGGGTGQAPEHASVPASNLGPAPTPRGPALRSPAPRSPAPRARARKTRAT